MAPLMAYALWRMDDNGNRALVASFADLPEAERVLREYEARGHKQTDWIERAWSRIGRYGK